MNAVLDEFMWIIPCLRRYLFWIKLFKGKKLQMYSFSSPFLNPGIVWQLAMMIALKMRLLWHFLGYLNL